MVSPNTVKLGLP